MSANTKGLIAFESFSGAILEAFGRQNRPKSGQVEPKTALETRFLKKSEFSRKPLKTNGKINIFEFKGRPKMTQDRPKTSPRRSYFIIFIASFFASIFARILDRLSCHLGGFGGAEIGHFRDHFWGDFCMSFQDRPKSAPRGSQDRSRRPQERPGGSQERPRRPSWSSLGPSWGGIG